MAGTLRYVVTIRTARQLSLSKMVAAIFKILRKFLTCLNFYCSIENRFLCIKSKERSIDCTSVFMFVFSIQECYWIANCFIKMLMNSVLHFNVCFLSLLTFKMVLMTLMLALMKVYFSLYMPIRMTHMNAQTCYWMLIKMRKS